MWTLTWLRANGNLPYLLFSSEYKTGWGILHFWRSLYLSAQDVISPDHLSVRKKKENLSRVWYLLPPPQGDCLTVAAYGMLVGWLFFCAFLTT